MQAYELEPEVIIAWATEYADYKELEQVAKALYAVYGERRRTEHPEAEKKARRHVKRHKNKNRPI